MGKNKVINVTQALGLYTWIVNKHPECVNWPVTDNALVMWQEGMGSPDIGWYKVMLEVYGEPFMQAMSEYHSGREEYEKCQVIKEVING